VALAALLGVLYLAWQGRDIGTEQADTGAAVASLSDNVDEALQSLADLREGIDNLDDSDADIERDLSSIERQIEDLRENYESVPARLAALETAMSSLQGISTGVRENWWLAEAEYYLQIANAQLQLAGNPRLASEALRFADERLRRLGNPALSDVRRALTGELQMLDAMETPDIEGITMRLASLADAVASLPIGDDVARAASDIPPVDPDAGPVDRAWASLKAAFGDVVSIRRTDEAVRPLLSPDARYFLRANLALQMQTARLALLRGEQTVFEQSLEDAEGWLRRYFDRDSAAVQSTLATLAEIRDEYTIGDPPDISESLRLLRQYRTMAGAREPVDPALDDPAIDDNTDNSDQ
jgi:uroporphyrin-3 C-methyltransferase